jgi:predicted nucleic acid-binding protein
MTFVLDSSVTLAWVHNEETTPAVVHVLDHVIESGAWVPSLWRIEVADVLEMSVRRNRMSSDLRNKALANLSLLPITLDTETDRHAWGATLRLAERRRLTLYDAVYLELALRRSFPLATLDLELRVAASAEGVKLLGM